MRIAFLSVYEPWSLSCDARTDHCANRAIATQEVIKELIKLAKEISADDSAAELITQVRKSVSIDWTLRESA
jgi:hypothetical protein